MINFIILLLGSLAGCYLIAVAIQTALKWFANNPAFLVGCLIGAIITAFCFIKFRRRKYSWARHYHAPEQELTEQKASTETVARPIAPQVKSDNDDLKSALIGLGYSRIEAKEASEFIDKEKPKASLEEKIVDACNFLSADKVRG